MHAPDKFHVVACPRNGNYPCRTQRAITRKSALKRDKKQRVLSSVYALTREIMAHFYAKLRGEVWRYSAQALSKLVRANSKTRRIRRK